MVVVVMAALAGFSFVASMFTENKAVHLRGEELQVEAAVASGEEYLCVLLERPAESPELTLDLLDNPDMFRGVTVFEDETTGERSGFSVISPRIEEGTVTGIRFGLADESNRLNLSALLQWDRTRRGSARLALMNLPNMTEMIADTLLDWMDRDARQRPFGAEADYYAGLDPPYDPRNGVPESLEELLLVRGVTRGLLFGADANSNYRIEVTEQRMTAEETLDVSPGDTLPWASLLTLYSAERNDRPDGTPRIAINGKDLASLHGRLNEVFDPQWSRFIIAYRQYGRYKGRRPATEKQDFEIDFSVRGRYKLRSVLDLIDAKVQVKGAKPPVILESPFSSDPTQMRDYLPELLDHLSPIGSEIISGRVNVNEAPRAVLLGVPGLELDVGDRIIAARSSQSNLEDDSKRHATWLLTDGLVDLATMKTLMPFLTVRGDVYRCQIAGFLNRPGPVKRVEVLIDATSRPARRIYWKDLQVLGLGFSRETLGATFEVESAGPGRDGPARSVGRRDR